MRIFDIEMEGKKYKVCCGLRALGELQKKYGSLKEFEKKLAPYTNQEKDDETEEDTNIDIETVMSTAKLFLEEGARATGGESVADQVEFMACNPFDLSVQLLNVYIESMMPENEEPEKNRESLGMKG